MKNKYIEQASAFVSSYRRFQLLLPEHQQDMINLMNEDHIDYDGYAAIAQSLFPESWTRVEFIDGKRHYVLPKREMSVHELMWFYIEAKNTSVPIVNREQIIDEIVLHLEFCPCSANFYPSLSFVLLDYIKSSITRGNVAVASAIRNYMSMNGTTGIDEMLPFLDREDVGIWTKNTILRMMIRVIASQAGRQAPRNLGGNRAERIRNCVLRLLEQMNGCNMEESPNGAFMLNCFLIISMIGNEAMESCKEAFQMLKDCPSWFRSMFIKEAGEIVCDRHNINRAIKSLEEVE